MANCTIMSLQLGPSKGRLPEPFKTYLLVADLKPSINQCTMNLENLKATNS